MENTEVNPNYILVVPRGYVKDINEEKCTITEDILDAVQYDLDNDDSVQEMLVAILLLTQHDMPVTPIQYDLALEEGVTGLHFTINFMEDDEIDAMIEEAEFYESGEIQ